ncbi:MAG: hypothetical protein L3J71_00625 [Victivallaceae bacterium]|nr:hypothetical protein [Victivallaceae bacterium]
MDISIHCPICQATYDVDDEVIGQPVTCECGQDFVATAEAKHSKTVALGCKLCPNCEEVVSVDSIICVDCGYNFASGTTIDTESSPEPEVDPGPGLAEKLVPLIKPLVILLVAVAVVVAGWFVYSSMNSKSFGITEENRLGALDELNKYFAKIGLVKRAKADSLPKGFGTMGKIYRYDNKNMSQQSNGALSETAFVAVDKSDNVCGIGGTFMPTDKSIVKRFIKTYWDETGCVKDDSTSKTITHKGLTASMTWYEYITDSKPGIVHGQWREVSSSGTGRTNGKNSVFVVGINYSGEVIITDDAVEPSGDAKSVEKMK